MLLSRRACVPPAALAGRRPVAPRLSVRPRVAFVDNSKAVDQRSVDPMAESLSTEEHVPGQIWTVHTPQQLEAAVARHSEQLVVLMCKSKTCRPCKMFLKKYMDIASRFPETVLLQILGDESAETRKLMVSMKVKVTPTFALFRGGQQVATVTGVSEAKLLRGMVEVMTPQELEGHEEDIFELEAAEKEEAAAEAAKGH